MIPQTNRPNITRGRRIPYVKADDAGRYPSVFHTRFINQIVAVCNAILNLKVKGQFLIADNEASLADIVAEHSANGGGTGTGLMTYKGEWVSGTTAMAQEVYTVSSGGTEGAYVCVVDGTTDAPDVGNAGWNALSRGSTYGEWL